jgi:phosphate transport system substrate-binding protein
MLLILPVYFQMDYMHRFGHVLKPDHGVARVIDEPQQRRGVNDDTDLSPYQPFAKEKNRLVVVDRPTLTITENHPRIGGALALYPIYAAAVQAIYKDFDAQKQLQTHVMVGTSPETFTQLLHHRADMVFMLEPSEEQYAATKQAGMQLHLTKVGREAFVFFVNSNNPVDGLSSGQIRDIYTRKTVNWRELGGRNQKILPFQRPEGSGSQTAMIRMMQGQTLTTPIHEEEQRLMGAIINRVADYRNYDNSIGYSFRFYVESMFQTDGVKLLTVDGVAPTVGNIRNGSYPFVDDFYIITNGLPNGKTRELIDWFLSPQGERLIEQTGYVPVAE